MAKYVRIQYLNKKITTVSELLKQDKCENISVKDFLDFKNPENGKKNREAIFETYTEQQKCDLGIETADDIKDGTRIYPPNIFYLPGDNVPIETIKYESQFLKSRDFNAFLNDEILKVVNSPDYVQAKGVIQFNALCNIRIWTKTSNDDGYIIDYSNQVINCQISVTETGGNFNIVLPPIPSFSKSVSSAVNDGQEMLSKSIWVKNSPPNILGNNENGNVIKFDIEHDKDYTSRQIMSNDVVFIKFEKLLNDYDIKENEGGKLFPNQVYDLIGLVDNVNQSMDAGGDMVINITGRDLIKLLIDDGSFFFMNSYTDNKQSDGIFINQSKSGDAGNTSNNWNGDSKAMNRVGVTGMIMPLFNPTARTIEYVMTLLVNTLSNIQICPDSLFEYYGDRRTEFNKIYQTTVKKTQDDFIIYTYAVKPVLKNTSAFGDLSAVKIDNTVIDQEQLRNAKIIYDVCLASGGNARDAVIALMTAMQESRLYNTSKKTKINDDSVGLFQQRISMGWADTTAELLTPQISAKLFFLGRKPKGVKGLMHLQNRDKIDLYSCCQWVQRSAFPAAYKTWEKNAAILVNAFSGQNIIDEENVEGFEENYTDEITEVTNTKELAPGIWQIIKLIIDDEVKDRMINDTSISFMQGSLLNFVNKVCQKPFVEFFTDTYGDQFYFIVRKPPFTLKSFTSLVTIDIKNEVLLNFDLSWNQEEIYSWYQLIPDGNYLGVEANMYQYQTAVFFAPYAEIWGSKALSVTSNYISFLRNGEKVQSQYLLEDLRFIVETHAYLPFTRTGSITIVGDRRIKRGMRIYLEKTNEYFYVDSVSNSFTTADSVKERVTTIHVSRGMIKNYVDSEITDENSLNYFNIINFGDNQYIPTSTQLQQQAQAKEVNTTLNHIMCKFNPGEFSYSPDQLSKDYTANFREEILITQADINTNDKNIDNFIDIAFKYKNVSFDLIGFYDSNKESFLDVGDSFAYQRAYSTQQTILKRYADKYKVSSDEVDALKQRLNIRIDYEPTNKNLTPQGRAQNRRVEVYVFDTYKKENTKSDDLKSPKDGSWKVNMDVFKFFINSGQL